jgi:molecular chaperone DnaJ
MGISLRITLEEAAAGCKKTISYDRLAPCDDCNGTGVAEGGHETTCTRCNGTGRVVEVQRTIFGQMQSQSVCPECGGSGKVVDKPCETCEGQGRTPSRETVEVEIPAGIHAGQSISLSGKGEAGVRGDAAGNLVVRIDVEPDERFERQGDDLFCEVTVDSLEAIVGKTVTMEGILSGEEVTVEVPACCAYGQQVTVEGHGMPRLGSNARGNLVAVVRVVSPEDLSEDDLGRIRDIVSSRAGAPADTGERSAKKTKFRAHGRKKPGGSR